MYDKKSLFLTRQIYFIITTKLFYGPKHNLICTYMKRIHIWCFQSCINASYTFSWGQASIKYIDFSLLDTTNEAHTILAAGLSGSKESNEGLGMKIYFREKPEMVLETVLRTPNRIYSITYNFTAWTVSVIHFVWVTNDRIELYRNYKLIGSNNGVEAPSNKPVVEQEYIMVFGSYNFSFNAISTELKYIEAWRIPFNSSQMEALSGKNSSIKSNSTESNVLGIQNYIFVKDCIGLSICCVYFLYYMKR